MLFKTHTEYVTKNESNAIKGLLILLIIAGHTHYLLPQQSLMYNWLYKFHVICFFILPFFYNYKSSLSWSKLRNLAIKFYVPYLIFFIVCTILYGISLKDFSQFEITDSVYAFLNGSQATLKRESGFTFLWFLPTFFSFTILKMLYDQIQTNLLSMKASKKKSIAIIFFGAMIGAISTIICFFPQQYSSFAQNCGLYIPFAIVPALRLFIYGLATSFIVWFVPYIKYWGAIFFVILSIVFIINNGEFYISSFVFSVSVFCFVLITKKILIRIPFLIELGKISFPVYLVHVIIYNILEKAMNYSILNSIIIYIFTVVVSVLVSMAMLKIDIIQKLFLPQGYNDIKSIVKQ